MIEKSYEWKKKIVKHERKNYAQKRKFTHERKTVTHEWTYYEWMKKSFEFLFFLKKLRIKETKKLRMNVKKVTNECVCRVSALCPALLCVWHLWWAVHTWMIIAHVVLRLYKRSTTTENKCSAIGACGWCVAQTLLTRGPTPHLGVSALCQRTLGSVRSTLSKNSSYSPFETHICWRFTISQLKKLAVAKPRPSPGTETCSDLRTKTANALGLKAIASEIEKTTCTSCTLDHQLTFVLHMLKTMQTVWIAEQVFQDFECEFAQRLVQMASVNRSRIVSSSQTELLLAFHPSCITSPRSATFPDSLRDSMPFEHWTLLTWPSTSGVPRSPTRSSLFARSQPHSTSQVCYCCHHDCCNHLWPTCSDHSRILRPGNGFVSVSAGFRSPSNDIQLQVTKCYPALQQQVTCLQVPQTSTDPTSSCNTPCCWAVTADLFRNIGHPVLVMWLNSRARARSSNQSVVLSFSAW